MSSSKIVRSLISTPLAAMMKRYGFTRRGFVFRRVIGDAKQVLQVQCGTGPNRSAQFVFNLGVLHPEVDRALGRRNVSEPSDAECTIRTRVGPRAKGNAWWTLEAGDTSPPSNLEARIHKGVLPWFDLATDLEKLEKALASGDAWSDDMLAPFGIAMVLRDRKEAAVHLQRAVDSINKTREARAPEFRNDPFGTNVLKRARRFAAKHGFMLSE